VESCSTTNGLKPATSITVPVGTEIFSIPQTGSGYILVLSPGYLFEVKLPCHTNKVNQLLHSDLRPSQHNKAILSRSNSFNRAKSFSFQRQQWLVLLGWQSAQLRFLFLYRFLMLTIVYYGYMANINIKKRTIKKCSVCGKQINLIMYKDHSYRGGHYFGEAPLITKKEWARVSKFGTRTSMIGDWEIQVMKKDPKPYGHVEYWECPTCYWRGW